MRDRFLDSGAIFAGWVGLGMALVLAICFELIIPVQTVVFLLAPLMGMLIGAYANIRAERWRPRARVLANAAYAGIVTGIGISVLYVLIRLVFLYGDSGSLPDGTSLICPTGPACTYVRYVDAGQADELAQLGITDGRSLEAAAWRELATTGAGLIVLTAVGGVVGGVARSLSAPKARETPLLARDQAAKGAG
ncbi:MAG: hypothetical protein ACR2H0_01220 [Candidatus Limnocylindrales bacterium]